MLGSGYKRIVDHKSEWISWEEMGMLPQRYVFENALSYQDDFMMEFTFPILTKRWRRDFSLRLVGSQYPEEREPGWNFNYRFGVSVGMSRLNRENF